MIIFANPPTSECEISYIWGPYLQAKGSQGKPDPARAATPITRYSEIVLWSLRDVSPEEHTSRVPFSAISSTSARALEYSKTHHKTHS